MIAIPLLTSHTRRDAATRRLAASSVAPVASRHLLTRTRVRPCEARVSRAASVTCSESDRQ